MNPMRVLHVNTSDLDGGAARAANRIHRALRSIGVDSQMLVIELREPAPHVHQPLSPSRQVIYRAKLALSKRLLSRQHTPTNPVLHSLNRFSSGLANWINHSQFDIVNLHWVGREMLSVEEIGRIRKPICWTMHDMWPFSGAEHYDDLTYPGRYRTSYTPDTRPITYSGADLDAQVWHRKRKAWSGKRFQLISPSRWLASCAGESSLMRHQPCCVIANCVDTDIFKPLDRRTARGVLNLSADKRYILFGAMYSTSDMRKGFHLLREALLQLSTHPGILRNTELLVFGSSAPLNSFDFNLPIHYLGHFHDEISLALLYSAADVFVAPSLQDNLPNTIVESLSCGTPCVAFNIGGMPDLMVPAMPELLANIREPQSLTSSLLHALNTPLERDLIRRHALQMFAPSSLAKAYSDVYVNLASGKDIGHS